MRKAAADGDGGPYAEVTCRLLRCLGRRVLAALYYIQNRASRTNASQQPIGPSEPFIPHRTRRPRVTNVVLDRLDCSFVICRTVQFRTTNTNHTVALSALITQKWIPGGRPKIFASLTIRSARCWDLSCGQSSDSMAVSNCQLTRRTKV
jgi:hypothetical protein